MHYFQSSWGEAVDKWTLVCEVDACPMGEAREFAISGRIVALYNVDGSFYALDGVCPHQGGPLGNGALSGCIVTCPWHGWQFDVSDGTNQISAHLKQPTFPVRVSEGRIFVRLD
ncbi:MAG: Rieske 2Fe-2S domain-containing protein [Pirellulaceae bacterium]|nr:Rieske 2Fe-2S domain-containing protein [Planctomycetales bacterium]